MDFGRALFCLSALLIQSIAAQCYGNAYNPGFPGPYAADLAYPGPMGCGLGGPITPPCVGPSVGPFSGPALPANIPPPGMSIYSDNLIIEGPVVVAGRMPFLGTVAVEGAFPTAGAGAITYGCGEGGVGIVAEIPIAPVGAPFEYGVIDGYAFNGLAVPNVGCGSRLMY